MTRPTARCSSPCRCPFGIRGPDLRRRERPIIDVAARILFWTHSGSRGTRPLQFSTNLVEDPWITLSPCRQVAYPQLATTASTTFVLLLVAGTVRGSVGCGDHTLTAVGRNGGAGGQAAPDGGPGGTPDDGETGGPVGSGGEGGLGGSPSPGGAGAAGGPGGAAGQPASSGGVAGGAGAGGQGGLPDPCGGSTCVEGAVRCNGAAPQACQRDSLGCTFWNTPAGQPAVCSANQRCDGTPGTCACHDAPRCGTPPSSGAFCLDAGVTTHATCNLAADGCFAVTTGTACAEGLFCETTFPYAVVATGAACGWPMLFQE